MDTNKPTRESTDITRDHPVVHELLNNPGKRKKLGFLTSDDLNDFDYLIENPWINIKKIITAADRIMDLSPETPRDELLSILCRETALLTHAEGATCRTFDPEQNHLVARGSYNWDLERTSEIPSKDSIAGQVLHTKKHYAVPNIQTEPLYKEKDKIIPRGIHSMLALPIEITDYEGGIKKHQLIGTLQLYFKEKNKTFFLEQIKLLRSIVNRFSYVLAQKSKIELQRKSEIIRQSRRALIGILKKTRSLDQVLSSIVASIAALIDVNRCSLFAIERDHSGKSIAVLIAGYPLKPHAHTYGITLPFDEHPAFREVSQTGRPLLIEEAQRDERMKANFELYLHERIKNVYFIPLKDENDVVTNVLVLDGDESHPLDTEELFFCNALIQDIELCIQTSLHSQQRHDFLNQMISFGAIAKLYTKKQASSDGSEKELKMLFKKLNKSMLAVNDIITDRLPFAQKEWINLNAIISERIDAYYFPPEIKVEIQMAKDAIILHADPKKVGRIIGNLLDNAHKKLLDLQAGVLEIKSYCEGPYAVFSIGNTGAMPGDALATLNDSTASARTGRPTGLGLSIVKLFTVMHNGILVYKGSEENNWTEFRAKLPLDQ